MVDVRDTLDGVAPTAHPLDMDLVRRRASAIAAADQQRQRRRFISVASVLILVVLIAVPTLNREGELAMLAGGGLPAIAGPSVTGEGEVALADFAGEPLLVHGWAPWCDHCIQTWLPDLADYAERDDAVQVITAVISTDEEAAAAAYADAGLDLPAMMLPDTNDLRSLLPAEVASQIPEDGVTMTLAFNATGTLVQARIGGPQPDTPSPSWTPGTWYQDLADIARTADEYTPYGPVGAVATPPPTAGPILPTPGAVPTEPFDCDALPARSGPRLYEVQAGDTLSSIAEAVYGDATAFGGIAAVNELHGARPLCVGEMLIIPDNPDALRTFETLPVNDEGERIYTVQPGDTLSTIAAAVYADPTLFGPIAEANGLSDGTPLQAATTLVIPAIPGLTGPPAPTSLQPPATVTPTPVPPDLAEAIASTRTPDITAVTETGASTWTTAEGFQVTFSSGEVMAGTTAEDVVAQELEPPGAAPITIEDGTVTALAQNQTQWLMLAPLPDGHLLLVEFGPTATYSAPESELINGWVSRIRAALT